MTTTLFLGDGITPFNLLRKNFKFMGYKKTSSFFGLIFMVLFLVVRVLVSPFLSIPALFSEAALVLKLGVSSMWFIGMIWSWQLLNFAVKEVAAVAPKYNWVYEEVKKFRKFAGIYKFGCFMYCFSGIPAYYMMRARAVGEV